MQWAGYPLQGRGMKVKTNEQEDVRGRWESCRASAGWMGRAGLRPTIQVGDTFERWDGIKTVY